MLYALLQRYGEAMCSDAAGRDAIATTADAMLALLQVRTCPRMLIKAAQDYNGSQLDALCFCTVVKTALCSSCCEQHRCAPAMSSVCLPAARA